MPSALIAIDQGTTSTRAIAFDATLTPLASAQLELRQIYPAPGEVEHDLEEIRDSAAVSAWRAGPDAAPRLRRLEDRRVLDAAGFLVHDHD